MIPIIALEDIPQEIKDEIVSKFKSVTYNKYGNKVTEQCVTYKSAYKKILGENVKVSILNPVTFHSEVVDNAILVETFLIRVVFNGDDADVYAIVSAGPLYATP